MTKPSTNLDQAFRLSRHLLASHYLEARTSPRVAWVTSGAPIEILLAANVVGVYPENHGALCGVLKRAVPLAEVAEGYGYGRDICSYARVDLGSMLLPEAKAAGRPVSPQAQSPVGGLPKPLFLLCCNNICGTVVKWYEAVARHLGVPWFLLDTPFQAGPTLDPHAVAYVRRQLEELMAFVATITGKPYPYDRLRETLQRSSQAVASWRAVLDTNEARPAPMTAFDAFVLMAPIVTLRGGVRALWFYRKLHRMVEDLAMGQAAAVEGERIRLVWDNLPIWFAMRSLSNLLRSHGANLVADTYTTAWAEGELFSDDDPLDAMARVYLGAFLNRGLEFKAQRLAALVKRFRAQGFLLHSNRSCKPYSLGQLDLSRRVTEITGKPGLLIEADMTDSRAYAKEAVFTRLEAFLEMVG